MSLWLYAEFVPQLSVLEYDIVVRARTMVVCWMCLRVQLVILSKEASELP